MTLGDTFRNLGRSAADDPRADGDLLARFVRSRDEAAFAELLRRHGPTVLGVCRRILGHSHDADDAFQAVFLVLARKADAVRPPAMVGPWLHGVAVRTANKARVMNAKRKARELASRERERPEPPVAHAPGSPDTLALIDAELAALPAVYRAAFVTCDLNGRSRSQAAKDLGWPEGTLAARLTKARDLLAARLRKRGVTLGAVTFAAAAVPPALAAETLHTVRELVLAGTATAVAPAVRLLSDEVVRAMSGPIWKPAAVLALVAGLAVGTALVAAPGETPGPRAERRPMTNAPVPKEVKDDGLIWTHDHQTNTLTAYTPDGATAREVKLPPGCRFVGLTADGTRMGFAGKGGRSSAKADAAGLTLHVGDISEDAEGADTGLGWKLDDRFVFSPDGTRVVRVRSEAKGINTGQFSTVLFDLTRNEETKLDLPAEYRVGHWTPDGKGWLVCQYNLGRDPELPSLRWLRVPADGGRPTPLCDAASFLTIDPSSDGMSYLGIGHPHPQASPGGPLALFTVADGKAEVRTALDGVFNAVPKWAPDGKRVACLRFESDPERKNNRAFGRSTLVVIGADGKQAKLLDRPVEDGVPQLLGWHPTPRKRNAPVPKAQAEWVEDAPILPAGGGRVTSVAFAPSGQSFAVCRDTGAVHFYKAATRERLTEMAVKHDPKVNPNVQVGTVTAIAFRPTPHPKLGDVFAVTHRNGVIVGTTNIGLQAENGAAVEGLPANWEQKEFDPHQVTWLSEQTLAATNGETTWFPRFDGQGAPILEGWKAYRHKPTVLAAIPGREALLFRYDNESKLPDPSDRFDLWYAEPMGKVSDPDKWRRISGHKARPACGVVSADGKRIVTGDEGGTLIVWEGEEFKEKRRVELGKGVTQLALASDGKTVAAVRAFTDTRLLGRSGRTLINLELHVFDVTDPPVKPTPLWVKRGLLSDKPEAAPASLAFSPDGNTLLAAFADPYIADRDAQSLGVRVWSLGRKRNAPVPKAAGEWKEAKPIELDGGRITSVAVSPDGKTIAVGQDEGVSVIDVQKRTVVGPTPFGEKPTIRSVAFSPDGGRLAVTTKDGVAFAHPRLKPVGVDEWKADGFDPHQVAWLTDQAVAATNGALTQFHRFDGGVAPVMAGWKDSRHKPTVLAATPGREALLFRFDNDSTLPDPRDRFDLWYAEPMAKAGDPEKWKRMSGHKSRPVAAAVAKDCKRIVTGDEGGTLIVWEGEEFKEKRRVEQGPGLAALALSAAGKTVAVLRTADLDKLGPGGTATWFGLYVFDITDPPAKPSPVWTTDKHLDGEFGGPASLTFSPDGATLYAAFADPYTTGKDARPMGVWVWERVPKK